MRHEEYPTNNGFPKRGVCVKEPPPLRIRQITELGTWDLENNRATHFTNAKLRRKKKKNNARPLLLGMAHGIMRPEGSNDTNKGQDSVVAWLKALPTKNRFASNVTSTRERSLAFLPLQRKKASFVECSSCLII
ncbi:hypothetical protein ISCGN_025728 [Ixodes scapularis]